MTPSQAHHLEPFITRAPANTILMGEHSVVYGQPAIAAALDQWLSIEWSFQKDGQIHLYSELGEDHQTLDAFKAPTHLLFLGKAIESFLPTLQRKTQGVTLRVQSHFKSTWGFGSSAAVLSAALIGLNHLNPQPLTTMALFELGHQIILDIQKRGSGTDLAASLYGGVIYFQPQNTNASLKIAPVHSPLIKAITLIYSGYKTPTAEVLKQVAQQWQNEPELLQQLYQLMGETTQIAYQNLKKGDAHFYTLFNRYHGLMDALGVNDTTLSQLVYQLRSQPNIHASKISGSGLGDCVIGLGTCNREAFADYKHFTLNIAQQGAHIA